MEIDSALQEDYDAWAVVVFRADAGWQVAQLPPGLAEDLDAVVQAVRNQGPGAFALVDVADEFFVAVRLLGGQERYLLSDAAASLDWDVAADVMDRLDLDLPDEEESEEVWPVGELDVFEDLGLDALELGAMLGDEDLYADELLATLAARLGFAPEYERAVGALV